MALPKSGKKSICGENLISRTLSTHATLIGMAEDEDAEDAVALPEERQRAAAVNTWATEQSAACTNFLQVQGTEFSQEVWHT